MTTSPGSGEDRGPNGNAFALLFSGGLDTTLEVVERLEDYGEAHLVTFDNGYCVNTGGASRRAAELASRFGADRIRFELVNTKPLIQNLLQDSRELWRQYRSPLIFDLACKMAAVTELIRYAKRNDLVDVSDGAAVDQTQIFIQHPEFSAHVEPFVTSYGLRLMKPLLFDMGRAEKLEMLHDLGFASGSQSLEKLHITSQLKHQPFCLVGFSTFFFTSPLRKLPLVKRYALPMDRAKELWDLLLPRAGESLAAAAVSRGRAGSAEEG